MRVAVAVHGRFHAFDLAAGLHRRAMLSRLITTYPAMVVRRFVPRDLPLATAPLIEIGRRLSERTGIGGGAPVWVASHFDRFAARTLPRDINVFVGWSGASLETIRCARRQNILTILERGSTHILHQTKVLRELGNECGVKAPLPDARLIERELAEYEVADAIMVGSPAAAETFTRHGIDANRVLVNPYGIDIGRFTAPDRRGRPGPVRVLFVGTIGLRKGVPGLLQAFSRLGDDCELHLVGPIEAGFERALGLTRRARVVIHGSLHGEELVRAYEEADIFCLTSIEEGLALVLLQAMASGLPLVATPATGIGAIGGEDAGAIVVEQNDSEKVAEAIQNLSRHPEYRLELGRRARRRAEAEFTVERYVDRAVAAYRHLLARRSGVAA